MQTYLFAVAGFVLAAGSVHVPFAIEQGGLLWNSEHYSFFPLVIAAVAYLVYDRLTSVPVKFASGATLPALMLALINLALTFAAFLMHSTWIGWISLLMLCVTAARLLLSPESSRQLGGALRLLVLIVPLPLGLDQSLVVQLQKFATAQGSLLLDDFGIRHAVSGVSIRLPSDTFLVDDACSGIHSLFSAVSTMAVYAVWMRYGVIRTVATVVQTFCWVLAANALRVFVIVYAFHRWNAGLESGWRHQAVGFVSYLVVLFLALSTDQLIRYLFRVRKFGSGERGSASWWGRTWPVLRRPLSPLLSSVAVFGVTLLILGIGASAVASWSGQRATNPPILAQTLDMELTAEQLPAEVEGWRQVKFERVNRDLSDVLGANSFIWTYESNGLTAQFSVDGYYGGFHDLWYCYSALDWGLKQSSNLPLKGTVGRTPTAMATELLMYRGDSEHAQVLFTCMDAAGNVVTPPEPAETVVRRLVGRLQSGSVWTGGDTQPIVPPVVQFQVLATSASEYLPHERVGIQRLFIALRSAAAQQLITGP